MKKFLMYVIIVITCLFLGFTIYYLTQNNENIYITVSKDETIYKNKGESIWLDNLIAWTKPYKTTTISITSADENVVVYDENTKRFDCVGGGFSAITITPSNDKFGPFVFDIHVGDGTIANPYIIDSAEDLALIGNDPQLRFNLTNSYILTKDIDLKSFNSGSWTPLGELVGSFNGDGHVIYNLNITSGSSAGLFSAVASSGLVENLKFVSATIEGAFDNVGVVAGVNKGTVGKIDVKSATINNTSASGNTGSIVGSNELDITAAVVNMCSAKATITTSGNAGGLVGYNKSSIVLNSYAIVDKVTASNASVKFGGLVGVNTSTYKTADEVYYASAIKNCYAIVNEVNGTANIGAILGENAEETYTGQMYYNRFVNCIYAVEGTNIKAVALETAALKSEVKAHLTQKTKEQLLEKATYVGYNFDTIWQINEAETATINYKGAYEVYNVVAVGKEITPNVTPLVDFLKGLVGHTKDNVVTYRVNENTVIDLNGEYWTTIAPREAEPMLASIYVEDGYTCVIKNFKLREGNSSFFGYISGNTIVSGITFENVTVESCNAENSAIVATGLLKGATLENITVKNYNSIDTQANNVGIICGMNKGTIKNCSVICDDLKELKISLSESLTSVGAIVGNNDGYVIDSTVDRVKLSVNVRNNKNGSLNFGGIVGTNLSYVTGCKVLSFHCDTTASGTIYAGGIAGYLTSSGSSNVINSYSLANIKVIDSNSNAFVGGIAGYTAGGSFVSGCFHNSGELWANNVGGLVGMEYGTVFSSYVGECSLKGYKVGGLASLIHGKVTDCYVLADLTTPGNSGELGGLAYYVGPDCYIEHNFSNATFSGNANYYAETKAEFRANKYVRGLADLFGKDKFGKVANNIILVNNGAKIQPSSELFNKKTGWIDATLEECNGTTGNYSVFKDKAGFDATIWNFDSENGFPTLINVAKAN